MHPKVVTPAVLHHIRSVIAEADAPSWLSTVPYNYGDPAAGTMKADEWRALGTIYIPIALISLWGTLDSSSTDAKDLLAQKLLRHTMLLVSAVILAMKNVITKDRTAAYRENIIAYIRDLSELFPGSDARTNHHVAVHIYDFMELFGPVKSWWCFPFERLI